MAFKTTSTNRQKRSSSARMYYGKDDRLDFSLPIREVANHIYGIVVCNRCKKSTSVDVEDMLASAQHETPFLTIFKRYQYKLRCEKCEKVNPGCSVDNFVRLLKRY